MKRSVVAILALLVLAAPAWSNGMSEDATDARTWETIEWIGDAPTWPGPLGGVLFDNGPLVTSPGTGANGEDESVLQTTSLGMNTLGLGHQVLNNNRIADDFTVPAGETWDISTATFYAYQTGSSNVSTMTAVNVQIWDGVPGEAGSNVVFGDTVTNRMSATAFSNILRVTEETTGIATDRPIMAQTVTIGTSLGEGTYWIDWQTDGTLGSGPWAPPITIAGQNTTGNGLQSIDGGPYDPAEDSGTFTQQGFPFILETGGNVGLDLSITGSCPGTVTIDGSGGTPNGGVGILFSAALGSDPLAAGPCAGTMTELTMPQLFTIVPLDGNGDFSITRTAPAGVCGRFLQTIDAAAGCTTSPAEQLPN